jgi:uncharacterized protein (DUF4415 family)
LLRLERPCQHQTAARRRSFEDGDYGIPPVKRRLSIRIDADVLAWLKSHGKGYHTRLSAILPSVMSEELKNAREAR